ncbi:MAG: AMP-binding protein [bacterium]
MNSIPVAEKPAEIDPDHDLTLEQGLLSLVEELAREINPRSRVRATLESSLQRDLGFDSLGLSELVMRTEKEFKVRLPDDLLGNLETPGDLKREIEQLSRESGVMFSRQRQSLPKELIDQLPDTATTLIEVLQWHALHHPDRPHILLSDGYHESSTIRFADLAKAASRQAQGMCSWGLEPGEFVGIMLPTGQEFFEAFFGTLLAGAVPVPMYPPVRLSQLEEHLRRQAGILRNSEAALLLVPGQGKALTSLLGGQIESLRGVSTVEDMRGNSEAFTPVSRSPDDLAMLQYTSGSTGDPKGVMLTHANLLANIRAMGDAIRATSNDVFVSWLPLYHDLGLIGAWFGSLYHAIPVVVMSPLRFIVRPESWLWAIHRNAATLSAAPNFAFELCANKVLDNTIDGIDLSSLRMVANGAEPVSVETIQKFTERFKPYGFRPEAMTPVYGLAESSVGLAFSAVDEAPIVDLVNRDALQQKEIAIPSNNDDSHPIAFVSCGMPLRDHQVRIVDALGRELPERQQGKLEFKGPSATQGYYRDPERTKAILQNGWLDSGDLAYMADGNIFLTGRIKDIIIKEGHNIYPQEVEEAVGNLTSIRKGCVAAFASADTRTGSERLIVVAETRGTDHSKYAEIEHSAAQKITDVLGMPADRIIITPPHTVPKTSSGKIRRSTTRELYENNKLGQPARALWLQVFRLGLISAWPRTKRWFKSLLDVVYAAWWWSVLVGIGAANWIIVLVLPSRAQRWKLCRMMARLALRLMHIPLTISGEDRLGLETAIIAANHSSYFDVLILTATLRGEPVFVAKRELSTQFVAGTFLRRLGARFVDRAIARAGVEEVEEFKALVRSGQQLVVFPESTFFRMPGLLQFRLGVFAIACGTNTQVLPIAIRGTRSILRGEQWFPRRGAVELAVLEPVSPSGQSFEDTLSLRDTVRDKILLSCGEPDALEKEVVFSADL